MFIRRPPSRCRTIPLPLPRRRRARHAKTVRRSEKKGPTRRAWPLRTTQVIRSRRMFRVLAGTATSHDVSNVLFQLWRFWPALYLISVCQFRVPSRHAGAPLRARRPLLWEGGVGYGSPPRRRHLAAGQTPPSLEGGSRSQSPPERHRLSLRSFSSCSLLPWSLSPRSLSPWSPSPWSLSPWPLSPWARFKSLGGY